MKIKKMLAALTASAMLLGAMPATAAVNTTKLYTAQTDSQDNIFQYHFAGGTDEFISGASATGRAYDAYLWVPPSVSPGNLKGLVTIKANLIEVPFVYSSKLKTALAEKGFGILWLVFAKDSYGYNNTMCSFNTRKDYKGDATSYTASDFTTDGKDAAQIMDDILTGIAAKSGYSEIADTTPMITIGHSAASPFGYRSGNWNPDRIIAQVHMKNGMSGNSYMVPGIPSLQYAAQYTEHDKNKGRDRSVVDARWHIDNQRSANTNALVSHIIEWGSGHYDWSDNATDMMVKYITKAIDYRLPSNYSTTHKLNDLTGTGYLMKPFEKDGTAERPPTYYKDTLKGWLSSGQNNSGASEADKKASFWYFDKEFADEVNAFTNYAIPPSPDSNTTKVEGATYSAIEPYMLMKNPASSTYANDPAMAQSLISPQLPFNANMSRYGSNRFVNYTRMANPSGNASNTAYLQGYDTATVDTYYMTKIPSVTANDGTTLAYDGAGNAAYVPANTKSEMSPLMAPYEIVSSELVDMSGMEADSSNSEAANVASVTRTTLRFHNNRVYHRAGNKYINEYGTQLDSFGMIVSPEIRSGDTVTSAFKVTAVEMNVPYTNRGSQTLTLNTIPNVNIKDANAAKTFDVTYTSSDSDLQKYTDVFVEYGPAQAVRTVDPTDGSYSWKIEILEDQIPVNATYPIEVNVVASNLGKWETVAGATAEQVFYITDTDTPSGIYLDGTAKDNFDVAFDAVNDNETHTITMYSDGSTGSRRNMTGTKNISVVNGDFAATLSETGNNMMFLLENTANTNPQLTFGKPELTATNAATALTVKAKSRYFTAEINYGAVNVYNGVIITGGSPANGGAFDIKSSGTVNMYGGIIKGNSATGDNGGGAICVRSSGTLNMTGGTITSNTSDNSKGGGVAVLENGTFNMSGGTISGNSGYDVYVNNNNMRISGSAKIGSLYLAGGKTLTVNGAFTTNGSHAEITPGTYAEDTTIATYAAGITPSTSDFTIAADGETAWYTYVDGQSLKLTSVTPYAIINGGNVTVQSEAAKGETVTVTVADNYVDNSLVVSGINPSSFTKVSDKVYSFTMPENAVTVSCLVNNDPSKVVVVGTMNNYWIAPGANMTVTFAVPDLDHGFRYSNAKVYVPARATGWNGTDMSASMNGTSYVISSGTIKSSVKDANINAGVDNTLTITNNSSSSGNVDYYSYIGGWNGSKYDYYQTAENLSTITLTKAVSSGTTALNTVDMTDAQTNADSKGYYIEDLTIPSWNPMLKWQITFTDGKKAQKTVSLPGLSGGGSVSIGLVVYGANGGYTTDDIGSVTVVE